MFEREVKFIYDFNSNKVKKLGPSATFTELLPLGIHPAILQYISAEIEFRVFEDRQTLLKHSMFDYSGPKITQHFNKITDEIKKEKRFSTDFICKVILHATSFNVNYLIRPNWSLMKLIFDTSESNNVAEILQILNYAYFYKHILKVIRNYLQKKKLITLDKEEFGKLLEKFDRVSLDAYGNDILASAIKSMSSFFNIGSVKQNTVPLQGIAVFLQEKKLLGHIERLQKNIEGEIKGKIEINDLQSILLDVPMTKTEVIDLHEEPDDQKIQFESDNIKPEKEEDEEEKLEDVPVIQDEETKANVEIEQELEKEENKEEQVEDEVEIKLRENKEKEVAETEKSVDEEPIEENESGNELINSDETQKEITDGEAQLEDEEINEASEYLVDQTDNTSDIILTVDDEEKLTFENDEEKLKESEKDEIADEEYTRQTDDETEVIKEEELNEKTMDENEEEIHILSELQPSTEEDYSYPILEADNDDEIRENDFEVVEDEELDDSSNDENLKLDEDENEEDNRMESNLDEDIEYESEEINEEIENEVKKTEKEEETPQETLFGNIYNKELSEDSEPEDDFIEKFGSQNHAKKIDIADLLENKNMTRIIAVVFDYDMEEFANAIEKICESQTSQEAFATLQEIFEINQVNPSSKEAQAFREIISEYFEQE